MKTPTKIASCSIVLLVLSSCGFKIDKLKAELNSNAAISYADVDKAIFKPNCTSCHSSATASGGVTLETYAEVKSFIDRVGNEIAGGTMPPSGPLSSLEQLYVATWIKNGAPEVASNNGDTPGTTPTPAVTPIPSATPVVGHINYATVRSQVLVNKCIVCHASNGSESRLPFDTYNSLMSSNVVTAGSPADSGLFTEIDYGSMPPRSSGIAAVTSAEKQLISDWITEGALEQ